MNSIEFVFDDTFCDARAILPSNSNNIYVPCQFEIFYTNGEFIKFFDDDGELREEPKDFFFNQLLDKYYEICFERKFITVRRVDRYAICRNGKIIVKYINYWRRNEDEIYHRSKSLKIARNYWGNANNKSFEEQHYRALIHPPYTLQQFINIDFDVDSIYAHPFQNNIERFITKIYNPDFIRKPGNENKKTFDYIRVQMNINTSCTNIEDAIKNNSYEIFMAVIHKIETHRSFKKYGIPVNFLRITSAKYFKDIHLLEMIIELKEV